MQKRKRKRRGRRLLAGLLIAAIVLGGAGSLLYLSELMEERTRSGQHAAVFAADGERLSYSILGQEGEIVWREAAEALRESLTALPARGRLLLWAAAAAGKLGREELCPRLLQLLPGPPPDGRISLV